MSELQTEVAKFAYAGRRHWREAQIDVPLLLDSTAVESQLEILEVGAGDDPNADRDAIEAAIESAIAKLPDPYRAAALDHFGFGGTGREPTGIESRRDRAAKHLKGGRSARWYRLESDEFLGLKPEDYVVALVSASLSGAADPIATVAKTKAEGDLRPGEDENARRDASGATIWIPLAVTVAVIAILGGLGWLIAGSPERFEIPQRLLVPERGSVVDAQSGDVWVPGSVQATMP
jgi:hypothetical protein